MSGKLTLSTSNGRLFCRARDWKKGDGLFPYELSENHQSNLDLIKSLSKEQRFRQVVAEKLKSGNFTLRWVLILALFLCPMYLEWTKASLRTDLPQNTREKLLLEVATTYKIKTLVREKFNIFIFIFSFCGLKQMKQTVKHSVVIEKEKSWKHLPQLLQML